MIKFIDGGQDYFYEWEINNNVQEDWTWPNLASSLQVSEDALNSIK